MSDAILIFTFSPVQSFITEARRSADLYVGSQLLVKLAQAAARSIEQSDGSALIYPTQWSGDVPNKLVARVPFNHDQLDHVAAVAEQAEAALLHAWQKHVADARRQLASLEPRPDDAWLAIWERQTKRIWEVYWAATSMDGDEYPVAYRRASDALDAAKRTRTFVDSNEEGLKDTLSGRRAALRTQTLDARQYWEQLAQHPAIRASKLRPGGRERLDAIGAVKRFCDVANTPFPSVSSIASRDFLAQVADKPALAAHRAAVEDLLGSHLFTVSDNPHWPYDGDLLYPDTFTEARLEESYRLTSPDAARLQAAQSTLRALYTAASARPALYYGILVLDGDSMGVQISKCLDARNPEEEHKAFSNRLTEFTADVNGIAPNHMATVIYNGGDDVLALAPLCHVVGFARALAGQFQTATGATASAGIAIVHHQSPLDAALRATREAEHEAKQIAGKAAVCVKVLRRSGEITQVRCKWDDLADKLDNAVKHFAADRLSSKLAYDVLRDARTVSGIVDRPGHADQAAWASMLRRLIKRHRMPALTDVQESEALAAWLEWAAKMDGYIPPEKIADTPVSQALVELGHWLVVARFMAQGGSD